jgi:hypothetical protein
MSTADLRETTTPMKVAVYADREKVRAKAAYLVAKQLLSLVRECVVRDFQLGEAAPDVSDKLGYLLPQDYSGDGHPNVLEEMLACGIADRCDMRMHGGESAYRHMMGSLAAELARQAQKAIAYDLDDLLGPQDDDA